MNATARRTCTAVALALTVLPISTSFAQDAGDDTTASTRMDRRDNDDGTNWGWLGLLGLAGLAGLMRRDDRRTTEVNRQKTAVR